MTRGSFCTGCGARIRAGVQYYPDRGASFRAVSSPPADPEMPRRTSRLGILGLVTAFAAGVVAEQIFIQLEVEQP